MKRFTLFTGLLGAALTLTNPIAAELFNGYCCDWSFGDGKITLGADWLYWEASLSNASIASLRTETIPIPDSSIEFDIAKFIEPKPHFQSGYRVNLGYEFLNNGWQFNAVYSNVPTHETASAEAVGTEFISASFLEDSDNNPTAFQSSLNGNVNTFDMDLSKLVCFGESFSIRPHIGFRALWLDEKHRYTANNALHPSLVQFIEQGTFSEKINGYGIESGLFANWNVGYGFSLIGHFGGSLLYSKTKINNFVSINAVLDGSLINSSLDLDSQHIGIPTIEYFVGVGYSDTFCDFDICAYAGWEQRVLFDVNQFGGTGNLVLQGLTLGLNGSF